MMEKKILKNRVDNFTIDQLHTILNSFIENEKKAIVDYLNIYSANISYETPWFLDFLNSCDIVLCDGKGIQLAARLLGQEVPIQVPYNRWLWDFFSFCSVSNYSIFFLGSKPGIYSQAISRIEERGIRVRMGGYHGYFNKDNQENTDVLALISEFKPDFLLVGFGMPTQEQWVSDNLSYIDAKVIILGGAYLDWISGNVAMTPKFISKIGMEWLYRLILEPRRLAHRYLVGIPRFFFRVAKDRFKTS